MVCYGSLHQLIVQLVDSREAPLQAMTPQPVAQTTVGTRPLNIAVFGANGPTGRLLTTQALGAGHMVSAFTRHPAIFPLRHEHLRVVHGDVSDLASVEDAVAGQDAVLSSLGIPYGRKPITLFSEGTGHLIDAMRRHGVRRLVCVTSSAVDSRLEPAGGFFFKKVLQPFFVGVVGKTLYADQRRMEALVMSSGLDWTVVRPSGLFASAAISDYVVAENYITGRFTSRRDLADFMLRQVTDDRYIHKFPAVSTVTGTPNFLAFLWKEGIRKKPA
jgi:putative NADH-flavin reductase